MTVRHDVYAWDTLAWVCFQKGLLREADAAIQKAMARGTQDARLFYHAGRIAEAMGDHAQAATFCSGTGHQSLFRPVCPTAGAILAGKAGKELSMRQANRLNYDFNDFVMVYDFERATPNPHDHSPHLILKIMVQTRCLLGILFLMGIGGIQPAQAHPMGNFSINHYARFEAQRDRLTLRYVLDFAEIPTVSERKALDADNSNEINAIERNRYLNAKAVQLRVGLSLTINNQPTTLKVTPLGVELLPGAGGLSTLRLTLELTALLPKGEKGARWEIAYKDANFAERTGWKEIIAVAGRGVMLVRSSVPETDISRS